MNTTMNKQTSIVKDASNKKLLIVREFESSVEKTWKAWTQAELLDKWWAPRPYSAKTVSMDFKPGGFWFYYMLGPEGDKHYCRADYKTIDTEKSFTYIDAFCDEKGTPTKDFPNMQWNVAFSTVPNGAKVEIEITFQSESDLEKIVEMGFKEGFAAAHGNLDELLAN